MTSPIPSPWISIHAFYASNADPLLVDCVLPMVSSLRAQGILDRYFFVKYWLEGPHVRLRLRPVPGADDEVRDLAERDLHAFLRHRPALYELNQSALAPVYKKLFIAEYGERRWDEVYGPDGSMPFAPTNTLHHVAYEPEFDRYGGPAGMDAAEWHFEKSSDLVLRLLSTANVHVSTVLLGLSAQLCIATCYALLGSDAAVADFFARYRGYWETSYAVTPTASHPGFDTAYERMRGRLVERLGTVRAGTFGHPGTELTPMLRGWVEHVRQLRERIAALVAARTLLLRRPGSPGEAEPMVDLAAGLQIVLGSYLHMTNNRLGVTINDEIYLAYVLERAVREGFGSASIPVGAADPGR